MSGGQETHFPLGGSEIKWEIFDQRPPAQREKKSSRGGGWHQLVQKAPSRYLPVFENKQEVAVARGGSECQEQLQGPKDSGEKIRQGFYLRRVGTTGRF